MRRHKFKIAQKEANIISNTFSSCIICYKRTCDKGGKNDLQEKFFRFLKRHVDYGGKVPPLENELGSCQDCHGLMKSFCQLYHDMKLAELQLNKKLWTITNIMKSAGKVKSRIKDLRETVTEWKGPEAAHECTDLIINFKTDLIDKCSAKLVGSTPKLIIPKFVGSSSTGEQVDGLITLDSLDPARLSSTQSIPDDKSEQNVFNPDILPKDEANFEIVLPAENQELSKPFCDESENGERNKASQMCEEELITPKPGVILQRLVLPNHSETSADAAIDYLPITKEDNFVECQILKSSTSHSNYESGNPAIPVIAGVIETKVEDAKMTFQNDFQIQNDQSSSNYHFDNSAVPVIAEIIETKLEDSPLPPPSMKQFEGYNNNIHQPTGFTGIADLRVHVNYIQLNQNHYKCDKCDKSFPKYSQLKYHKIRPHKPKPQIPKDFICECRNAFSTLQSLKTHRRNIHAEKKFRCSICDKRFRTQGLLTIHISSIHEKQRHYCQVPGCNAGYSQESSLGPHYKLEHPDFTIPRKPRPKPRPNKVLEYSEKLENGESFKLANGDKECRKCLKTYRNKHGLILHIKLVHLRIKPFKCPKCFKTFGQSQKLQRHINSPHSHKCDMCLDSFITNNQLILHKTTLHDIQPSDLNSKIFSCQKCDKVFSNIDLCNRHYHRVHTEKKFQCNICNKKFKRSGQLDNHISCVHETQKVHCQVSGCNKTYSHPKALADHYNLKHPAIPKAQKPQKNLNYSVNLEQGETIIECRDCPYKFKTLDIYKKHRYPVHNLNNSFCVHCGYSSSSKLNVDTHIKLVHSISSEDENKGNERV